MIDMIKVVGSAAILVALAFAVWAFKDIIFGIGYH